MAVSHGNQMHLAPLLLICAAASAAPDDFNCQHSDLLYIYPEGSGFKAIYFDNEGHVIHYAISFPARQPGRRFLTFEF